MVGLYDKTVRRTGESSVETNEFFRVECKISNGSGCSEDHRNI